MSLSPEASKRQKLSDADVAANNPQSDGRAPSVGLLSGISYNSGIDYYRGINERYIAKGGDKIRNPAFPMPSFPQVRSEQ